MDFLRALVRLPVALIVGLWRFVVFLLRMLGVALSFVVGRVNWQAPAWMLAIERGGVAGANAVRANPGRAAAVVGTLALVVGGGWFGYRAWRDRPRPPEPVAVTFAVTAPRTTNYESEPTDVAPLQVQFSGSVAPIDKVGKEVADGIAMTPPVAGTWTWNGDKALTFAPKEDWPVGQAFKVRFDKAKLFAPQVRVPEDHFDFSSAPFVVSVANAEFYQDPQDAAAKKTIMQLHFTHPVDTAEFEKRLSLELVNAKGKPEPRKFVVNYDKLKLNAFVHSEPLAVPKDPTSVRLTVAEGVRAARGGTGSVGAITANASVPGLYSLGLASADLTLVDNARFEPEQVLLLELTRAVGEKEIVGATKAWLLPVYNPKTPEAERNGPWSWSYDEVDEKVLKESEPLALDPVAAELEYSTTQSFKYRADPGRYVYVQVGKGLRAFGGYQLADAQRNVLRVPDYARMLRFMADGALLSLSGEKRVAVVSRNVPGMKLEIARVLPDQLQHLVTFNQNTFAKPELGALSPDQITDRFEQKIAFSTDDPVKAHYEGVDLGRYLADGKRGVFLLKLSDYDPASDQPAEAKPDEYSAPDESAGDEGEGEEFEGAGEEVYAEENPEVSDKRFIVVTDLGLIVKKNMDGTLDAFVQSIANGRPVDGASIEVLGKNGQTLLREATDHDGRAHFGALDGYTREKSPALFVVKKGDDLSFLPVNGHDRRLDFSRFDVGGIKNARNAGQLSAYLFSDRGLYRPGDTFHIGMIVRAADWTKPIVGVPLEAEILDARGLSVERRKLRLGEVGFEELAYTTQETSPTGSWTINLSLVKDDGLTQPIGSTTVQVKEFLPDRMKATARLSQEVIEGWIKPENLSARVSLMNLFGTPAQNRRVEATLTLSPVLPVFRSYPQHVFHDPQRAKEGYSEPLGEQTTNDKGEAEFPLDLAKYGTASYRLHFLAKGYEPEGGRSVSAEAASLVSSLDYLVGAKVIDNLDYVNRGDVRTVNLIAIDPSAKRTAVEGLKAVLVERRYVSVLTKQDSGVYKYESRLKEIPVKEEPLTIPAAGIDFKLATGEPGDYSLVVKNNRGEALNQVSYSVAGEANLARSLERNAELQLALSKKDYAPGEDVEIAVRAPYAGSGLITIERDKVYAHAWFTSKTTGSVQKIRVPADFEGNGYVNVQYVRDAASNEVFMSPMSYGVAPFSVNRDARRNAFSVASPAWVKPGDTLTMKVTAGTPSRVAVFAVDEGILQVARYKLGDPLDHFFQKRMLEVSTSQILDLILPEFARLAGMAAPGGDADGLLGKHLNPFKKKRKPPVAYWSGIVEVSGEHEFKYAIPDEFNGKLRVMAVAVAPDRIGTFETSTTVRGDFVLSPNVPSMVAPGDEFEVSVGVANNLTGLAGKELPVAVKLEPTKDVEAVGEPAQTLNLGEGREGVVVFRLRAKGEPGAAALKFTASSGEKAARMSVDLSVRPAVPYRTEVAVGNIGKGDAQVKPLRTMFDAYAKRDASASYVPLVLARGLASYLDSFPHKCTEQLLSAAIPAMVFDKRPEFGKLVTRGDDVRTPAEAFKVIVAVLRSRQNAEGGFGLWSASPDAVRYVSVYATLFLLEAKERGFVVPQDLVDRANNYVAQLAADESDGSLEGLRERAFAVYVLTRQGKVTTNALATLRQRLEDRYAQVWKTDIAASYVAATLQLLKEEKEAAKLIAGPEGVLKRTAEESGWHYARYYDPLIRDTGTLYLVARHFPERAKALPPQALANIVRALQKGWFNTLSSATTILALDTYATSVGSLGGDNLALAEVAADGKSKPLGKAEGLVVRGAFGAGAAAVSIANAADLSAWYTVAQTGYDRTLPDKEIKEGIEIVRELTDANGRAVAKVGLGDEVYVHIKIRSTRGDGIGSVAIVDLLPGGFEPVQEIPAAPNPDENADGAEATEAATNAQTVWRGSVGLPTSTWMPEYADVRDDRVVIYGTATTDVREFVYRIKATNAGSFVVPPPYGESMYERTVQAQGKGGRITVERPQ
ncbi:alpha-2-macroglobulin [Tahibacter soli]|uniref:Alpha-2-macroglobulin n=1 Tax=Tahibacter soli TaxID=2983605 RepID=A0A9X3YHF5_9GAMM|nr:alpha-2-macroglobulin [Tahibacter soli]MDC8011290.1 alpha-2-macroglobulin [Tahibacter soli]